MPGATLLEQSPAVAFLAEPGAEAEPPRPPPSRFRAWRRSLMQRTGKPPRSPVVRVPVILQMDAAECGAAALAMVLAYHGRFVPLEDLRLACGVSRDGSKASNILKAAKTYGLIGKGYRHEPEALRGMPVPAIIHWNFNHFVVLEGMRPASVQIVDPSGHRREVTLDEFEEAFTGVVLTFEPGADFVRGGPRSNLAGLVLAPLRASRPALLMVALLSVLLVVPGVVVPHLAGLLVDRVVVRHAAGWLAPLCAGLVLAGVCQGGITWLQHICLLRIQARLGVLLSGHVLTRLLDQGAGFFAQRFAGELADRVAAADDIARLLSGQAASAVFNLLGAAVYGAAMLLADPATGGAALLAPVCGIAVTRLLRIGMRDSSQRAALDRGKLFGRTVAVLAGIETIKIAGSESDVFARWTGQHASVLASIRSLSSRAAPAVAAPVLLFGLGTAAILCIGGVRVIEGGITLGGLVAIQALLGGFSAAVSGLAGLFDAIQLARGGLERIADFLNAGPPPAGTPTGPGRSGGGLSGRVELCGLSFGYSPTDPPMIRDFSLALEPGMRVAIAGASGSGKSTIGRMVAGLLKPWSGEILFDGIRRADIPQDRFAAGVAHVDQDIVLFEGSVRDNLTLWNPAVPDEALIAALTDAAILDDVMERPGGLDAAVAEGGLNFSGGQRQRLEIARALVGNPALIILDEATSGLDSATEQAIDRALRRRGCSCLIIAHRVSAIREADEIVLLHRGRIAERGTHAGLLAAGQLYAAQMLAEA